MPTSPTVPIAAARTTLGSVRASSTNPATPSAPTSDQPARAHPGPAGEQQQAADHQRQVGARDGEQVGQPGGAERVDQLRGHAAVVAVDQRRHQRPGARGCVGDRLADRGAQPVGAPRPGAGPREDDRWPARAEHPGEVTGVGAPAAGRTPAAVSPRSPVPTLGRRSASTGARTRWRTPRPVTVSRARAEARRSRAKRPCARTGSEVTTTRAATAGVLPGQGLHRAVVHRLGAQQGRGGDPAGGHQPRQPAEHLPPASPRGGSTRSAASTSASSGDPAGAPSEP